MDQNISNQENFECPHCKREFNMQNEYFTHRLSHLHSHGKQNLPHSHSGIHFRSTHSNFHHSDYDHNSPNVRSPISQEIITVDGKTPSAANGANNSVNIHKHPKDHTHGKGKEN